MKGSGYKFQMSGNKELSDKYTEQYKANRVSRKHKDCITAQQQNRTTAKPHNCTTAQQQNRTTAQLHNRTTAQLHNRTNKDLITT